MWSGSRSTGVRFWAGIQDFTECAATGRQPLADFELAYSTTPAQYAGYWSAEEGKRIKL